MIAIIDYGVGNLCSIRNMLNRIGVNSLITSSYEDIRKVEKLILPGVGNFDYGMEQLQASNLVPTLNEFVLIKRMPILGICLGAQLLTNSSQEGKSPGLGWIDAKTVSFDTARLGSNQKIPHMGWSNVFDFNNSLLFKDMYQDPRFYFVHSYHLLPNIESEVMVKANYAYNFAAGIEKENILGVQFHPEKSHKFGMKILENFVTHY